MSLVTQKLPCRSCNSSLIPILHLGDQQITGWVDDPKTKLLEAPLSLVLCSNPVCSLVQLEHTVDADTLWRKADYGYRSGISSTMVRALDDITTKAQLKVNLEDHDVVVDIGANDGTLLDTYSSNCVKVAYEPIAKFRTCIAKASDYPISDYFSASLYPSEIPDAKIVTAAAMMYDLDDPHPFVAGVRDILADDGIFVIQLSYLPLMLLQNDFLNVTAEHIEYYSIQSLEYLLNQHGLFAFDAEINDINGGSLRLYVDKGARSQSFMLYSLREWEKCLLLDTTEPYDAFHDRIQAIKDKLTRAVRYNSSIGKSVYGYAASTKGNVLLQFCEFNQKDIVAIAERNPEKWNKFTAGSGIPIISEDEMREADPDFLLVLAWAFMDEFRHREKTWHD